MKYLIALLSLISATAYATTITLTPAQINKVLADNPCEVCEVCEVCPTEPPIDPPPIDPPPVDPPGECHNSTTLSGHTTAWHGFFDRAFPEPQYENKSSTIGRNRYLAVEFFTGNHVDGGENQLSMFEQPQTPGIRKGSISKCKGDFTSPPAECKYSWGLGGGIRWTTNGSSGCKLDLNTTYYFNMTFTNGTDPNSSTCPGEPCRINVNVFNY
jgi:hypothetical protein